MSKEDPLGAEHRKYLRLDTVFPVTFQFLRPGGVQPLSDKIQGFTNNISKGGICLAVNNLKHELTRFIKGKEAELLLEIEVPFRRPVVRARAGVVWVKDISLEENKYLIGLKYLDIDLLTNKRLMRYAWTKKMFAPGVTAIIVMLGLGLAVNSYLNFQLTRGNKDLVGQLVKILQESAVAKQNINQITRDKESLQLKIQSLQLRIQTVEEERAKLEEMAKSEGARNTRKISDLSATIDKLIQDKAFLQDQLISLQHKESAVTEELLRLDQRKVSLTQANFDKMYRWLMIHQNPRTGLVMSFEGDSDIAGWAFIYDESLASQAYVYFGDFERAKKIFEFFDKKAKGQDRLFYNAYYATDGSPAEYTVHSGPNIWLGIAVLQYVKKSGDSKYLPLAEGIAEKIILLQDKKGGIRGGPDTAWYATEHNLDAYAFFNMLHKITGKEGYLQARDKVLRWLVSNTYDKVDIPIMRGKGDATIATDTYAWSIAAIGPEKLEEVGMNPDQIMEFAEKTCAVEVDYLRPEGQSVKIKGFDFAPQKHVARGGVVSPEWTSQMIIAFKIMAEFYNKKGMTAKARSYEFKANEYLGELCAMIISSPSPSGQGEGCLPYASVDSVDTGHGWVTPKGKNTGSVSGTAYTLFAYYNYNPLELKE